MRFILIRHCLTDWNELGLVQGLTDIPLNNRGRDQAEVLAHALAAQGITRIVCSPLSRASETATIIGMKLRLPVRHDARLKECGFGTLEGKTPAAIAPLLGGPVPSDDVPYDFSPFGGERRADVIARHEQALQACLAEPVDGATLIVGHGRGLNTLLRHLGEPTGLKRGDWRAVAYDSRLPS